MVAVVVEARTRAASSLVKLIDAHEAAYWLGTTLENVRVLAHRDHWRRRRLGRHVWYALDDVTKTRDRMALRW